MLRKWTPVAVLLLAVSVPAPARAGGALLDFDQDFYVPGDVVRAHSSVWLKSAEGRLDDGPYFAYLSHQSGEFPPPLPPEALRVAPVEVVPRPETEHGDAYVEFALPEVEPGTYWLTLCNDPCKLQLGDIMATELVVASDAAEGRMVMAVDRLSARLRTLRILVSNRVLGHRAESLRGRVTALERDVTSLTRAVEDLRSVAAAAEEKPAEDASSSLPPLLAFLVPAALLGVLAGRHYRKAA